VIAVHQTVSFFLAFQLMRRFKTGRGNANQTDKADAERQVGSLGAGATTDFIDPASVAENTTELLEAVPRVVEPGPLTSKPKS
jgi:hypothetical protein